MALPTQTIPCSPDRQALMNAEAGVPYSNPLNFPFGTSPFTTQIVAGAFPGGIGIAGNIISGNTPGPVGTFNFDIKVTDAKGCSSVQPFSITVVVVPV